MDLVSIKRRAVPLHAEVSTLLSHQILSGALLPGEKLPPLDVLAEEMGVARMTVRQGMSVLEEKGFIERRPGRGTFVRHIDIPKRHVLHMQAPLAQIYAMVEQLKVRVIRGKARQGEKVQIDGKTCWKFVRIHTMKKRPFCHARVIIDSAVYARASAKFATETAVSVIRKMRIPIASARQRVGISYADVEVAHALEINVNTPVFNIHRRFFDGDGNLIYSANLIYPGDVLEFEIDFTVD